MQPKILTFARGMIAMNENTNRKAASQLRWWLMKLSGTNTRRIFSHDPSRKNL